MTTIVTKLLAFADQMDDKAREFEQRSNEREDHNDISFDLLETFATNVANRLRHLALGNDAFYRGGKMPHEEWIKRFHGGTK